MDTAFRVAIAATSLVLLQAADLQLSPAELFQTKKVWTIHLKFTADQWTAMEPADGVRMPGGPGRINPASPFLKGDLDSNGTLSKDEFQTLAEKWFSEWDGNKTGTLTPAQLREGAAAKFRPEGMLGAGPGRPGRVPGMGFVGANGRNGMSAASGIDFQYVHADLEFEGRNIHNVAVRYKGNNTFMMARNSLKRSFKIDLNRFEKGQTLGAQTTLNLHNNITDVSWMNEVLSYEVYRNARVPAPRTAYVRVYVTVPGRFDHTYFGLYSLVENIDKHFVHDRYGTGEGALLKPVTRDLFSFLGEEWSRYKQIYDPKTDLTKAQKTRVIEFARLVSTASDKDFAGKIASFLNLGEFGRFLGTTVWLSALDSILTMGQNFYVYLNPKTEKFEFLPWDLDHSFGKFPMAGGASERLNIDRPWQGSNRFLERVFQIEAFRRAYRQTLASLQQIPETIGRRVDQITAAIRPAIAEESNAALSRFDSAVSSRTVQGGIKPFVIARAESVRKQLAGESDPLAPSERGFRFAGPPPIRLLPDFNHPVRREEFLSTMGQRFAAWDADHNGQLTTSELQEALQPPPPQIREQE